LKEREKSDETHTHHGKNPLVTRLSIKANNSSKRVVYDGVDKPDMVHQEHQQTQRHQHKLKLLLLHAAKKQHLLSYEEFGTEMFFITNDS